jgi:hypothetical protein
LIDLFIADEIIQSGNKLLFVTAIPVEADNYGRYLTYSDLKPVVIKISASWKPEKLCKLNINGVERLFFKI